MAPVACEKIALGQRAAIRFASQKRARQVFSWLTYGGMVVGNLEEEAPPGLKAVLQMANDERCSEPLGGGMSHSDAANLVDEPNLPDHVAFC